MALGLRVRSETHRRSGVGGTKIWLMSKLQGHLNWISRRRRKVARTSWTKGWNPAWGILQFCHPFSRQTFCPPTNCNSSLRVRKAPIVPKSTSICQLKTWSRRVSLAKTRSSRAVGVPSREESSRARLGCRDTSLKFQIIKPQSSACKMKILSHKSTYLTLDKDWPKSNKKL